MTKQPFRVIRRPAVDSVQARERAHTDADIDHLARRQAEAKARLELLLAQAQVQARAYSRNDGET